MWHSADEDRAENEAVAVFDSLDAVQRDICDQLFRSYITMVDRIAQIDFEPPISEVTDHAGEWLLQSWPTAVIRRPSFPPEYVKIRTGQSATISEEAAVLLEGATEPGDFVDLLLAANDQIPITLDSAQRADTLTRLFGIASGSAATPPSQRVTRPGYHCYGCGRAPYCGEYPTVSSQRPGSKARLIIVSKTGLARAANCDRRGAWNLIHRIPKDPEDESNASSLGLMVHDVLDDLLRSDQPSEAMELQLGGLPPSEVADVRMCIENHLSIDIEHDGPLTYRAFHVQTGLTVVADSDNEGSGQVAVVFIADMDATARESDGTPAIVEHKTTDHPPPFERDLYAVAGWHLIHRLGAEPASLAVHHHHLRRHEAPRCDRRIFDRDAIRLAEARLHAIATRIAGWDPVDALLPPPKGTSDTECTYCEHRERCLLFDGPV